MGYVPRSFPTFPKRSGRLILLISTPPPSSTSSRSWEPSRELSRSLLLS
ncbi:hypothetical protein Cadr_000025136 [Camelus dromedarius]|uniref:Uncharacterized protein n=1 Tax=Camelus dromedarius TaxID=9838 RepID=A0A5N4CL15_CAMDR|nr:hypothetical protein Cadr_000025136 [Camelus dromedarius]